MKYRLAAFDFDGTLADSFGWLLGVMGGVAGKYGFRTIDVADLEAMRGLTLPQSLARLGLPLWKVPRVAAHVRKLQARDIEQIRLFDRADEMLRELADNGVTLAIVSSNSEQNVRRVLGQHTVSLIRHYRCGASLLGKRAKLKAVLRKAGVMPADAIYIGDEIRDIEAARDVGMASGAVSWGYGRPDVLRQALPTEVFETPSEVVKRLVSSEVAGQVTPRYDGARDSPSADGTLA